MGNLVQLTTARRLQDAGHTPYLLVGGATGMIGDPKESGERTLNSLDTVKDWTERVRRQIEPFLSFDGTNAATMVNNYDWTASLSTIDFLRDVGKHFPVNRMLARDVVRSRLEDGISYTEFSYVLLQSMDFLNLFRDHGVTLQHGGSDQWGNITGGAELHPSRRRRQGARLRDPADHQGRRHQVRQDRGRRPVARPRDDVAVRLLPVLAQRRGRPGRRAAAHLHVPLPRGDRGPRAADRREAVPPGRPEGPRRARHDLRARRGGDRAHPGRLGGPLRRRRPARPGLGAWRPPCARRAPSAPSTAPASSTCSSRPVSPRARARPAAPSTRVGPTSTTPGSRTSSTSPRTPTSSTAPGWCCGGASATWPVSRSTDPRVAGQSASDLRKRRCAPGHSESI